MNQDAIFSEGEGDRWFQRNARALSREEIEKTDPILRALQTVNVRPRRVIEIGASNGYRLHLLHQLYGCEGTAVEPSEAAIAEGRAKFPHLRFERGVAAAVPIREDEAFDLVIVNFVLHWVDRATLLRSCAELDRLLVPGGFLIIGDFHPPRPQKVRYHHRTDLELFTYKQNYAEIFLATRLYTQFSAVLTDTHHVSGPDVPPQDRVQVAVLKKTGEEGYETREFLPPTP